MKNKISNMLVVLSVLLVTIGINLNFDESIMGHHATGKNVIVTVIYIIGWLYVLGMAVKKKATGVLICFAVFWTLTLIFAMLTAYVNATPDTNATWAIPFVMMFLTPWYGVMFWMDSFIISSIMIAIISLIIVITLFLSIRGAYSIKSYFGH
ncbi:hypothetical protein V1502_07760 [Bacillus sp. SCS-153A]|uniref:hypothetical protein n=1 Tax=Rossellomorea sedimentorum TaxID=3115294 RepID=UPI003905E47D